MKRIRNFTRLNDYFFKNLMGEPKRKRLTLDFLNTTVMTGKDEQLVDLKFKNTDVNPDRIDGKLSRLDIQAIADNNKILDIEVQVSREDFMPERSAFYLSRIYGGQLLAGEEYPVLKPVIGVNLLNFKLDQLETLPSWHNYCCLCVPHTDVIVTRHLEMHFLELPKLKISDIRNIKKSEVWGAYFSGRYSDEELEVLSMSNPLIKEALDYEAYFNSDEKLRQEYIAREEAILDEKLRAGYNRAAGIKEGEDKKAIQIATNLLKAGISNQIIAQSTGLSLEDIAKLK